VIEVEDAPIQPCALLPPIWQRRCFGAAEPGGTPRTRQSTPHPSRQGRGTCTCPPVVGALLSCAQAEGGKSRAPERLKAGEHGDGHASMRSATMRNAASTGGGQGTTPCKKPGLPFSPCHSPTYNTHTQALLASVDWSAIERPFLPQHSWLHNWQHNSLDSRSRFRSQPRARSYSRCRAAPMRVLER
jgi:hypothetical protein